jgi:hypothetical protein
MSAKEAQSWKYYKAVVGCFGREREDYFSAAITSAIYHLASVMLACHGEESEPVSLKDCMLQFKRQEKEMSIEDIIIAGKKQADDFIQKHKKQ